MKLLLGNNIKILKDLKENSIDSIVTDPPYGLKFMGKKWDYDVPSVELWQECLRVLKPGGHLLSFAGTRTHHRMCSKIEEAGFEIRDMIAWVYGSGFPKSLNIGKAIDKLQNNSQYEGYGTALKPALEPITLARKPLSENSIAHNVLKWGTGGINIEGCRIGHDGGTKDIPTGIGNKRMGIYNELGLCKTLKLPTGRFPANFIHDGSYEVLELFPNANSGNASRYFYCAKASNKDREEGLDVIDKLWKLDGVEKGIKRKNIHPTVKPTKLMQYLVRLVTPPGGTVLDPFMGSGSTGKGCLFEGFKFVGIEIDKDYFEIAKARININRSIKCHFTKEQTEEHLERTYQQRGEQGNL